MKNKQYNKTVCFYFQVHQPYRLNKCNIFDKSSNKEYFEGPEQATNKAVFKKVSEKSYLPANKLMLKLLKKYPEFKIAYSLSGVFLEQCLEYGKIGEDVLKSFKDLVATGQVELLSETYYHSLSWLYSKEEFAKQIIKHKKLIYKIFKKKPSVFRNTELIYNNEIAEFVRNMGFKGIVAEGWEHYLGWRSPNFLYNSHKVELEKHHLEIANEYSISKKKEENISLLLKNYKLSDDIAFRFSNKAWSEWPLKTDKFSTWLNFTEGDTINLFMDYETFGEHQWEDTGIFDFMESLPKELFERNIGFKTPSETIKSYKALDSVDIPYLLSWADMERDLSAWRSNDMQESALSRIFELETDLNKAISKLKTKKEKDLIIDKWRKLQTSDHFYYMCTKYWGDGDVHAYFSPYESPYNAFIIYMNTVSDFEKQLTNIK